VRREDGERRHRLEREIGRFDIEDEDYATGSEVSLSRKKYLRIVRDPYSRRMFNDNDTYRRTVGNEGPLSRRHNEPHVPL